MRHLEQPYENLSGGQWLRGNLHAHTTHSDGVCTPQAVIDSYAERGYDFLMLSDHDIHTSAEELAEFNARDMILIPGNEVTVEGPHLLHVNGDRRIEPHSERQQVLNDISATQGFAVINHPNWHFDRCTIDQLREWSDFSGIEIYNGVISRLHGSPYATNKWDRLLARGRRVWGFANDDSHRQADVALGWNMVYAENKSLADITASLKKGRFYASTGVVINEIGTNGLKIRIETENADKIVALQATGKRFAETESKVLEVDVPHDAIYVRFECWGRGEQFAWTQPMFVVQDDLEKHRS